VTHEVPGTEERNDEPEAPRYLRDALGFEVDLDLAVAELMEQEAACRISLELAQQLPPPSLDDFLS